MSSVMIILKYSFYFKVMVTRSFLQVDYLKTVKLSPQDDSHLIKNSLTMMLLDPRFNCNSYSEQKNPFYLYVMQFPELPVFAIFDGLVHFEFENNLSLLFDVISWTVA